MYEITWAKSLTERMDVLIERGRWFQYPWKWFPLRHFDIKTEGGINQDLVNFDFAKNLIWFPLITVPLSEWMVNQVLQSFLFIES